MLLYSTFWIRRRDSCPPARSAPVHTRLDSFITRQVHGIAMHSRKEFPFASRPLPLSPSRLLRVRRSDSRRRRQLRITAARLPPQRRPQALEQPRGACRQKLLRANLINTKFENSHVFLSWYAEKLNTNNLSRQMILNGSSCIPAILFRVWSRTSQKDQHSGRLK